jgi:hypothetical protein
MKSLIISLLLASCAADPDAPFKEGNVAQVSNKTMTFYPVNSEIYYDPARKELSFSDPKYGHITLTEPFSIIYGEK